MINKKIITEYLKKNEIKIFRGNEKSPVKYGNWIANSFAFESANEFFLLETGCTYKRENEIRSFIKNINNFDIINTHWHLDHTANNGKIANKNTEIIFHPKAKLKLEHPIKFYIESMKLMFAMMDTENMFERYGFNKATNKLIHLIAKINPKLAYFSAVIDFKSYYGITQQGLKNITYLNTSKKNPIILNNININGWDITNDLIAFETPGHTDDSISFLLKDRKALIPGDTIFFPSPNSITEGSISDLHKSLNLLIKITESEKIEFIGSSHYQPIVGHNNILAHLTNIQSKQLELYSTLKKIIEQKENWTWKNLVNQIYLDQNKSLKEAINKNYKEAPGFIDNYIYLLLSEKGFSFNALNQQWKTN